MSFYPVNSTAKKYHDMDGNDVSLYKLVRAEPGWAETQIIELKLKVQSLESELRMINKDNED